MTGQVYCKLQFYSVFCFKSLKFQGRPPFGDSEFSARSGWTSTLRWCSESLFLEMGLAWDLLSGQANGCVGESVSLSALISGVLKGFFTFLYKRKESSMLGSAGHTFSSFCFGSLEHQWHLDLSCPGGLKNTLV